MDCGQLRLQRLSISNYKSVRRVELDTPPNLVVLMGPNDAGKSNILDSLRFLQDATEGFDHALRSRGRDLVAVLHKKKENAKVEVVLEFVLPEKTRQESLAALFAGNRKAKLEEAALSGFLQTLACRVSFGKGWFVEELTTPNLEPGRAPLVVAKVKGDAKRIEQQVGLLESACAQYAADVPDQTVTPKSVMVEGQSLRLCMGELEASDAFPVSRQLGRLVRRQLTTMLWISPERSVAAKLPIRGETLLAPDASNLADVLHWLHNNRPKLFRRVEAEVRGLLPRLGAMYTPTFDNETSLGFMDEKDEDLSFTLDQMGHGVRSALAVVTRVLLAEPGAWICLEEPETHLHPRAQAQLLAFLDRESAGKRIFIATHSTPLAAQVPIESLFLVNRDAEECTRVSMVTIQSAGDVISQLGVQPSLDMDAAAVVFVEDVDLIPVYEAWAAKFPFQTKVQFMPLGGAETLLYHANLRVVSGRQVHTRVYVVGGQAVERDSRWHGLKTKLVKQLELPADHVVTLDVNWVEDYLLDATTIASAFPKATLRGDEFESRLATCQSCDERKLAVTELYSEIGLRLAYAEASARLAGAMKQIPKAVRVLFERIDVQSRPFWSV